ncbi:MAG: 30S ribosomal protein S11 [Patescibacteria group bacterium]|jgi:small subunit ribosomal protein S11
MEPTASTTEQPKVVAKPRGKRKATVLQGRAYIQATYNNTIITITDQMGNVIGWSSAGHIGFKGPKKATPYAASLTVKDVLAKVQDTGIKKVDVFVKGVGSGRESAIRSLGVQGLTLLSIKDTTPIPHNGCRPPKPRRV